MTEEPRRKMTDRPSWIEEVSRRAGVDLAPEPIEVRRVITEDGTAMLVVGPLSSPETTPAPDAGLRAARKAISDRYDDLRWCGKDDDCHIKAEGAALALSDFDAALSQPGEPT